MFVLFYFQYMTLMKDGATMLWAERKDLVDSVDLMWNKYVQFLPEAVRPTVSQSSVCVCVCACMCVCVHLLACVCTCIHVCVVQVCVYVCVYFCQENSCICLSPLSVSLPLYFRH